MLAAVAQPVPEARAVRVLVLTAPVGEGHVSAARALVAAFDADERQAMTTLADALTATNAFVRLLVRDAYRWQLKNAPWIFGVLYEWMLARPRMRRLGARCLAVAGGRRIVALVTVHQPDVIVSTFPAATAVLASLRRRQAITVPTVAVITDLGGFEYWIDRSIDLHLVMHEACLAEVERKVGRARTAVVQPLVCRGFDSAPTRCHARRRLGINTAQRVVIVSGGGWAAGDITGALEAVLSLDVDRVVCLTGHNLGLYTRLTGRFASDERVFVMSFTRLMPELLASADVLVHTTAGVTCLEAWRCGCPVIAYGAPPGHAVRANRRMADLGLVQLARDIPQLVAHVHAAIAERGKVPPLNGDLPTAADLILDTAKTLQLPLRKSGSETNSRL